MWTIRAFLESEYFFASEATVLLAIQFVGTTHKTTSFRLRDSATREVVQPALVVLYIRYFPLGYLS